MKLRTFLLVLLILAFVLVPVSALSNDDYTVYSAQNFNCTLVNSILFQLDAVDYTYVALEPLNSTFINGTSCNLWMAPRFGGKFVWTATCNSQVQLNVDMNNIGNVRFNGYAAGDGWQFNLVNGNQYILEWSYTVGPLISLALILGLLGVGMTFGGPFYIIYKWRENHDFTGMINGIIIMLIGAALLLGWVFAG